LTVSLPPVGPLRQLLGKDDASIPEVWCERAKRTPDQVFLVRDGVRWTYAEAFELMCRFAGFLRERGYAGSESRVASYLPNVPEAFWVWFGTHCSGSVYFPLNRAHKGVLLSDMLSRTGARILVTESSALSDLPDLSSCGIDTLILIDATIEQRKELPLEVLSLDEALSAPRMNPVIPKPGDLATIMFTSGTTGRSKAVLQPHNMYCRNAARLAEACEWNEREVFHAWLPLYHIAGQLHQTMSMVAVGGAIWQFPTFSRSKFWSQIEQSHATIVIGLANVLTLLWSDPPAVRDCERSLRTILSAAVPKNLHRPFEKRFGVRIMEQYGMTEIELLTVPTVRDREVPLGSCGRVGPDFELSIFDETDAPVPFGTPGEIVARPKASGLMMLGYDDDAVPTVETWQNLWFHTEDIGYLDDRGFLFFVDRSRHVIRRRSENISSWELENILLRHPDIAECAVVGIPSTLGEQDVKASICLKPNRTIGPAEVYQFCRSNMARFMVPRYIEILSELPHNHVGKIEKTQLLNVGEGVWDAERAAGHA